MIAHRNLKLVKLFVLTLVFLLGAVACIPDGYVGIWVNMDDKGVTDNGVVYDKNDILFQPTLLSQEWELEFDGELYGLTDKKHDISAFSFNESITMEDPTPDVAYVNMELYLSFEANRARVPGVDDRVMGQDIVKFTELISDTETIHTFEMFFDGSDVGLTTNSEKVDGITVWPTDYYMGVAAADVIDLPYDCNAGVIFVSTKGSYRVPDNMGGFLVGDGSDVLGFCAVNTGPDTAGFWVRLFDSSEAGITPRNAVTGLDVFGLEIETLVLEDSGNYELGVTFFFTPRKTFKVNGVQTGGPSQLFIGSSVGDTYIVNGPVTEFNEPGFGPALNGPVENISVMESPFGP